MNKPEEYGGSFGTWILDENGLPAYNYTCNQYAESIAKTPTSYGYSNDHFHQIGNDKIAATVHNGGFVQFLESSRGFQWLTYHSKKENKFGGGIVLIKLEGEDLFYSDLYNQSNLEKFESFVRIFGMGYFRKEIKHKGIKITHNVIAPFSNDPALISQVSIINETQNEVNNLRIIDFWDIYIHHILRSLVVTWRGRKKFGRSRRLNIAGNLLKHFQKLTLTDTESSRRRFNRKFKFNFEFDINSNLAIIKPMYGTKIPVKKEQEAKHNYYPKNIFLSIIKGIPDMCIFEQQDIIKKEKFTVDWEEFYSIQKNKNEKDIKNPCLAIGTRISLKPGEKKELVFIFGYEDRKKIPPLINKYHNLCKKESILKWNAEQWKKSLIILNLKKVPWISREIMWHSYYTRSACYFDEYWNKHKFPQGSVYQFGHGLDGAIRDYILYLYPIIFMNPQLAKEYLSYAMSFMTPEGKLPYSIFGFAKTYTGGPHAKPSDLYIFLIWGIIQYVYSTRDFKYLEEKIPFYPKGLNEGSTVLERLELSLKFIFSENIGIGSHGLIKCNDGDWSDGISLMVSDRKKFIENGESTFNSTFMLYVLPKVISLLEEIKKDIIEEYRNKYEFLKNAVLKSWNGKWFYRGWDGQGNPIGDNNIYLEHHTWLLIADILSKEQNKSLIQEIYNRLDEPSPIGQFISFPAQKTKHNVLPKGWDVNGGIWHAINSLMIWAYSLHDPEKAINSLLKNSLYQRAIEYPNLWYGIWSGPDSYIADYVENAGEAFYHLPTPMCDFPIMNLNIHACYLLSVIKMTGFEEYHEGISINPQLAFQEFSFESPLFSIIITSKEWKIKYNPINSKGTNLRIRKPRWWNENSLILLNEEDIMNNTDIIQIENDDIVIKILEVLDKIQLILKKD